MLGAFINLQNIFKVCYPISLFIYNINKNDIMTLLRNYYTNRYEIFREYQNCYREELYWPLLAILFKILGFRMPIWVDILIPGAYFGLRPTCGYFILLSYCYTQC